MSTLSKSFSFPAHQAPWCPHLFPHIHTWPSQLCARWLRYTSLSFFSVYSLCLHLHSHALPSPKLCPLPLEEINCHGPRSQMQVCFMNTYQAYESHAMFDRVQISAFLQGGQMEWFIIPLLGIQSIDPVAAAVLDKLLFQSFRGLQKAFCPLPYQPQLHGYCVYF